MKWNKKLPTLDLHLRRKWVNGISLAWPGVVVLYDYELLVEFHSNHLRAQCFESIIAPSSRLIASIPPLSSFEISSFDLYRRLLFLHGKVRI